MPKYDYKLTNGKTLTLEGDTQPTDSDVESAAKDQGVSLLPAGEEATWWQKHPKTAQLARGALSTLPAVGALGGAMLASPGLATGIPGLVGEAAAVGLGAGAGKGAEDLIAEKIGLQPPTTPGTKALRIGGEAVVGAGTAAVVPGAIEAVKTPIKTGAEALRIPAALRKLLWSGEATGPLSAVEASPKPILSRPGVSGRVDMTPQPKLLGPGARSMPSSSVPDTSFVRRQAATPATRPSAGQLTAGARPMPAPPDTSFVRGARGIVAPTEVPSDIPELERTLLERSMKGAHTPRVMSIDPSKLSPEDWQDLVRYKGKDEAAKLTGLTKAEVAAKVGNVPSRIPLEVEEYLMNRGGPTNP